MSRTVQCVKLGREAEGLERQPYPGALGQRIFDNGVEAGLGGPGSSTRPCSSREPPEPRQREAPPVPRRTDGAVLLRRGGGQGLGLRAAEELIRALIGRCAGHFG